MESILITFNILHLIFNANIMLVFYYVDHHTSFGGCYWRKGPHSCPPKASESGPPGVLLPNNDREFAESLLLFIKMW